MNMISKKKTLALLFSMAVMAGCSSTDTKDDGSVMQPVDSSGGQTDTMDTGNNVSSTELSAAEKEEMARAKEEAALREIRTFYFDFDKSELKPESRLPLMAHAKYLAANPSLQVAVEGHCDERGTKEYNMALGERRSKAIEQFLVVNGVSKSQIETLSFGEENPVALGHDEESWSQNRRAVLAYK